MDGAGGRQRTTSGFALFRERVAGVVSRCGPGPPGLRTGPPLPVFSGAFMNRTLSSGRSTSAGDTILSVSSTGSAFKAGRTGPGSAESICCMIETADRSDACTAVP